MTNKTTSTTRFTLDFFNKTISGTKASFNKAKRTYDGLDYKFMEDYIATFEDDILSNTYESVKKLAKDQGLAVYPMTKNGSWLVKQATNLNEEQTEHKEVKQNTNAPSPISTLVDKQILAAG